MWRLSYRDRDEVPALQGPMQEFEGYLAGIGEELLAAWSPPRRAATATRATLGHCLRFTTWQSLSGEGLSDEDMAALCVAWVSGLIDAGGDPKT
jgi:hypothetical protein